MTKIAPREAIVVFKILICLGGIGVFLAGISLCFIPEQDAAKWFFSSTSFFLIGALFLLWINTLLSSVPKLQSSYLNFSSLLVAGLAMTLTTVIFIVNPPSLRLHTDEVSLLGTSRSFYSNQTVDIPREAVLERGKLKIIRTSLPTRPLLFPFLTNLIHRCKGFDLNNVFILNFIGLSLLLILMSVFIARYWGLAAGISVQFAIVSHPIIWHTASSGIADLFNALFFFISALSLRHYLRAPSAQSLTLLILSLCLLGNIRYESIIFLFITLATLFLFRRISWEHVRSSLPILILGAICFLPFFWQRSIFITMPSDSDPTISNFGPQYLLAHLPLCGAILLSLHPTFFYYFTPLLTPGIAILLVAVIKMIPDINKHSLPDQKRLLLWFMICLLTHVVLICSFSGGLIERYETVRFFIIESIFLSTLSTIFLFSCIRTSLMRSFLAIAFPLVFILQLPLAAPLREEEIKVRPLAKYYQAVSDLIGDLHPEESLLIIDFPIEYILRGWPAIRFNTFNADTPSIKKAWDAHEYHAVYYIKRSKDQVQSLKLKGGWTAKLIQTSTINKHSFVSLYTLKPKK